MARPELVYKGMENRIVRELTKNSQPLDDNDKQAITRVVVWVSDEICLDTENPAHHIEYADGKITMQIGLEPNLQVGEKTAYISIFDPAHTVGGLASGSFQIEVVEWPKC